MPFSPRHWAGEDEAALAGDPDCSLRLVGAAGSPAEAPDTLAAGMRCPRRAGCPALAVPAAAEEEEAAAAARRAESAQRGGSLLADACASGELLGSAALSGELVFAARRAASPLGVRGGGRSASFSGASVGGASAARVAALQRASSGAADAVSSARRCATPPPGWPSPRGGRAGGVPASASASALAAAAGSRPSTPVAAASLGGRQFSSSSLAAPASPGSPLSLRRAGSVAGAGPVAPAPLPGSWASAAPLSASQQSPGVRTVLRSSASASSLSSLSMSRSHSAPSRRWAAAVRCRDQGGAPPPGAPASRRARQSLGREQAGCGVASPRAAPSSCGVAASCALQAAQAARCSPSALPATPFTASLAGPFASGPAPALSQASAPSPRLLSAGCSFERGVGLASEGRRASSARGGGSASLGAGPDASDCLLPIRRVSGVVPALSRAPSRTRSASCLSGGAMRGGDSCLAGGAMRGGDSWTQLQTQLLREREQSASPGGSSGRGRAFAGGLAAVEASGASFQRQESLARTSTTRERNLELALCDDALGLSGPIPDLHPPVGSPSPLPGGPRGPAHGPAAHAAGGDGPDERYETDPATSSRAAPAETEPEGAKPPSAARASPCASPLPYVAPAALCSPPPPPPPTFAPSASSCASAPRPVQAPSPFDVAGPSLAPASFRASTPPPPIPLPRRVSFSRQAGSASALSPQSSAGAAALAASCAPGAPGPRAAPPPALSLASPASRGIPRVPLASTCVPVPSARRGPGSFHSSSPSPLGPTSARADEALSESLEGRVRGGIPRLSSSTASLARTHSAEPAWDSLLLVPERQGTPTLGPLPLW